MVLTHYTEMVADKHIVLVRGDIVSPSACSRGEVRGIAQTAYMPAVHPVTMPRTLRVTPAAGRWPRLPFDPAQH